MYIDLDNAISKFKIYIKQFDTKYITQLEL